MRSDAGRLLTALRDNDARCTYLGIDTSRTRIIVLVLTSVIAGLAGFGYAAFGAVAAPENASFTFGTRLIIMVALGGRGTIIGAIVGALTIEVASAYLSGNMPERALPLFRQVAREKPLSAATQVVLRQPLGAGPRGRGARPCGRRRRPRPRR